jgi:apolipoprotein N-acyltransferase
VVRGNGVMFFLKKEDGMPLVHVASFIGCYLLLVIVFFLSYWTKRRCYAIATWTLGVLSLVIAFYAFIWQVLEFCAKCG